MWLTGKVFHVILRLSNIKDNYSQRGEKILYTERNVLRGEMAKHGVTVRELAKGIGVSTNTMSKKINGRVDFSLTEIRKTLAFFRLRGESHTVESLFNIE